MRPFHLLKLTRPSRAAKHTLSLLLLLFLTTMSFGQSFFAYPPANTIYSQDVVIALDTLGSDTTYFPIPTIAGKFIRSAGTTQPDSLTRIDFLFKLLSHIEFSIQRVDTMYADSVSAEIFPIDEYFAPLTGFNATYNFADSLGDGNRHRLVVTDSLGTAVPFGFGFSVTVGDSTHPASFRIKSLLAQ